MSRTQLVSGSMSTTARSSSRLAGSVLGVGGDGVDVGLVYERGPGQHGLAASDCVAIVEVQPERVDREVALQERLLVDGPLDSAGLDRVDEFCVRVEGADLCLAARVVNR